MMRLAIVCNDKQYSELTAISPQAGLEILRISEPAVAEGADLYMDLLFNNEGTRIAQWNKVNPGLLIIGAVEFRVSGLNMPFILINNWPGFLQRDLWEAAAPGEGKEKMTGLCDLLNRKLEWVQAEPGLVSARVISMIINEAFLTVEEGVTDVSAIDTAMKLGTNYPYGPFEWAEKIGHDKICSLLELLAAEKPRYRPAASLSRKANVL